MEIKQLIAIYVIVFLLLITQKSMIMNTTMENIKDVACNSCNLKYKPNFVPEVFHVLSS
jgi:hypothetical protein